MLVPTHEIAFCVQRSYGDALELVLKDFSMEMQLRPSKFLFVFEPGAVVASTIELDDEQEPPGSAHASRAFAAT